MEGGTTFHFVTEGIEAALDAARAAAGERDVHIAGGAQAAQQYLNAGSSTSSPSTSPRWCWARASAYSMA
jgi:dihydrofolate reductase